MNTKVDKRLKRLTILLIPDDDTEPFSINVTIRLLKILAVVSVVLLIHIILGGIFYWQYAVVSNENTQLEKQNEELAETRDKIYKILPKITELQKKQEKFLNALGVNPKSSPFSHNNPLQAQKPVDTFSSPDVAGGNDEIFTGPNAEDLDFLKEKDTQYHDFIRNMPTRLPVSGYMSQDFETLQWFNVARQKSHLGIDIVADEGTPIHAAGDGFVLFADWTPTFGNLIIIYHGSGFFTYYGHNHRNLVVEKTPVQKGEIIALVGNSGESSGPHLHFEIWRNGVPMDPKEFILSFRN